MNKLNLCVLLIFLAMSCSCSEPEVIEIVNKPSPEELNIVDSMTFYVNEFVKQSNVDISILSATSVVHSLPYRFGDAGDLYEEFTFPTVQEFYQSGLVDDSFKLNEQTVAIVKVIAFYPENIHGLDRGEKFDCFIITLGNAIDISKGKIFRTGLFDSKFPSDEDPVAVIEGDLSQAVEYDTLDDDKDDVPIEILNKYKPTKVTYADGTGHQPRLYVLKNAVKLIRKPQKTRQFEPVITFSLKIGHPEIILKIKQKICEFLPYIPEELEYSESNDVPKIRIPIPLNYNIDPFVFAEQLKFENITLVNPKNPLVVCDVTQNLIQFLGKPPEILKTFESNMTIEEGAYSDPFVVIPHNFGINKGKTEVVVGVEAKTDVRKAKKDQGEFQAKHHFVSGFSTRDVLLLFQNKYNYGFKEKLNFLKHAIAQKAVECTLLNRSQYYVFNSDKTVKLYPQSKTLSVGNKAFDYPLIFTETKDETIIDLDITTNLTGKDVSFIGNMMGVLDKSVFWVTQKSGSKKKYRIHLSDKVFQTIFDARILQILTEDATEKVENYRKLFDEIVKMARLAARIEMQVSTRDEDNARTLRNAKYFINNAVAQFAKEDIPEFEWDVIFSSHKNDVLYPVQIIPQSPKKIFAIIKEEQVGLQKISLFKDYLDIINLNVSDWQKIYELRVNFIKESLKKLKKEAEGASEKEQKIKENEAKTIVKREIEGHSDIPLFTAYIKLIESEFGEYISK